MESAATFNAFRVLSMPADAAMKDIYRQQQRLLNSLEIGNPESLIRFKFLSPIPLGTEILLEAVHRIERHRMLEEMFWVHGLDGKIDLSSADPGAMISSLRSDAKLNTVRGAVARHNLAVILHYFALECPKAEVAFDYLDESLSFWDKTFADGVFWEYMQDRAEGDIATAQAANIRDLKNQAKAFIQKPLDDRLWRAIKEENRKSVARITQLTLNHTALLDSGAIIDRAANQLIEDGTTELGPISCQIATVEKGGDSSKKRAIFIAAEKAIRNLHTKIDSFLHCLSADAAIATWDDLKAVMLGRLSAAYFNTLDDMNESLRLVAEASESAQDADTKQRLARDWRYVQRGVLCSEAISLMKEGHFSLAEQKFAAALTLSTDEQKQEIQDLQQTCHRARAFHGVDASKKSPTLQTINGIGATFYGRRDFDSATKTYTTNHWFVFLFLPIIPIASYRVSDAGSNSYHIYGRLPLPPWLKKWRWGVLAAVAGLIIWSNVDSGSSLSSSTSGAGISPTYSSTPSNTFSPSSSYEPSGTFRGNPTFGPTAEKEAIEAERASLQEEKRSLDEKKRQVDEEGDALNSMESYIKSVRSTYTEENIPDNVRTRYNATVDDYNSRVPAFNTALESLKSSSRAYQLRVDAFNARVDRYNSNR
ncbi:MAG TPA: hypothetical protein VJW20_00210 [Candidatus Angelobacter sp.]|nr:hypothetical protein [Candidatus Angelobacter sp.]